MALTVLMARIVVSLLVTGKMGFLMLVMKKWILSKYLLDLHWRSRAPDLVFYIGLDRRQDPAPRQSNNITALRQTDSRVEDHKNDLHFRVPTQTV